MLYTVADFQYVTSVILPGFVKGMIMQWDFISSD